tara:strand:+ start:141 stop:275 length:135 start_codon:yes stop_codon:yes gene_type:complete
MFNARSLFEITAQIRQAKISAEKLKIKNNVSIDLYINYFPRYTI